MEVRTQTYGIIEYDGSDVEEFARRVSEAIKTYKVVHVKGVDLRGEKDLLAFYDEVTEAVGDCYYLAEDATTDSRNDQKWFEVRFDPNIPNAYRHSANGQPLHTDGSYISDQPPVTFMFCINSAPEGGATIFLDADDVVELLEKHEPELLEELQNTEVTFAKVGDEKRRKIVDRDEHGVRMNWNYYCVKPGQGAQIDSLRERLFTFQKDVLQKSDKIIAVALEPGEAVAFQDERVLHGRNGFTAHEINDRFLYKAFVDPK